MIIAFTGAHSCGKSTLVDYFRGKENFVCLDSCTRSTITAEERKVDGLNNLDSAQLKLLDGVTHRMAEIVEMNAKDPNKIYVMDRCVFDFIAYSRCFANRWQLTSSCLDSIERGCADLWNYIDVFFYLPIEFPIVNDGVRSLDEDLRKDVDSEIREQLLWNKVRAVELTGPVKKRVSTILDTVKRLEDEKK